MANSGYVYVLVNSSLPDCVKIGKTTRDVSKRAAEISAATGVPTPFLVVYEMYFDDCDLAENWVHAHLESKGVRLSANREFFSISSTLAVDVINEAKSALNASTQQTEDDDEPAYLNDNYDLWNGILQEARDYRYGDEETIPDKRRAIELYKRAAKLGSEEAYIQLADLLVDSEGPVNDPKQGVAWLKQGVDRGFQDCILALADVFANRNTYFPIDFKDRENALRCYRRFFKNCDVKNIYDCELFIRLKHYLTEINGSPDEIDRAIVSRIVDDFRSYLEVQDDEEEERTAKLMQLNELVHLHSWVGSGMT